MELGECFQVTNNYPKGLFINHLLETPDTTHKELVQSLHMPSKYVYTMIGKLRILDIVESHRLPNNKFNHYYIKNKEKAIEASKGWNRLNESIELYEAGLNISRISKYVGVIPKTMDLWLIRKGIHLQQRKTINISVEDYYKLKEVKNKPIIFIRQQLHHDPHTVIKWLKFFNWFNPDLHDGHKKIYEINDIDELDDITERKFYDEFSKTGKIHKLRGYYCDFIYEYADKNVLVEVKKTLDRNSFPKIVLQLVMGEKSVKNIFNIKIDEKWFVYEKMDMKQKLPFGNNQRKEIINHFNIKMIQLGGVKT